VTVTRRSPTREELRIWRDFIETGERLRAVLASRLQSESDLTTGDYAVLLALSEAAGKRLRSSDLALQIAWERSRLSHHLGRMESRGLIERQPCATDSRGSEVVLTELGTTHFRRASAPHLRAVQDLFIDALTPQLLDQVDEVTRALQARLDATGTTESS
jgi:DNA-binding MarR family transcriptional regulator